MHHQDPWSAAQARDRRDVADKIEAEVVVQCRVERVNRRNVEQRVAVRRRAHDCFGGDIAAGARPVLDDEWLAETLRQRLTDQACKEVRRAARRLADDQVHRPCRCAVQWLVSSVFGALPLSAAFRVAPTKHCLQPPQVMLQFLYNIVRK